MKINTKGFTLIEITIVIFVLVLLVSSVALTYRSFEKKTELKTTTNNILSVLQTAQTKTLASEQADVYGVHFESDKYVMFKGNNYNPLDINNKIHLLSTAFEIYDINLGGNADVVFQRISGSTNNGGSLSVRLITTPSLSQTIYINSSGRMGLSSSGLCCQTNRLVDSRHVHLNLGWSIQNSNTLRLRFIDTPEVVSDINMADYFDTLPNPTEFDWSGTINVNGENQLLRLHTHSLDIFNTVLCIHRDRNYNNKPLGVFIDNQLLITYTAGGDAVVGAFGGSILIQ